MADQRILQLEEKTSLDDNDYIIVANGSKNYRISGANIKATINVETNEIETYTISADTTDYIISLGAYTDDKDYQIMYKSTRGSRYRSGILMVKPYSGTEATFTDNGTVVLPLGFDETGGVSFATDVSSNSVRLKITTDNNDTVDTNFVLIKTAL